MSPDKTSLGAFLPMMMNGALKSEWLVESWALAWIDYIGNGIFGRSTSERMRAIWGSELAGCLTSFLTTRFTSRLPQPLPGFVCCVCCFGWGLFWFFVLLLRGVVVGFFLT